MGKQRDDLMAEMQATERVQRGVAHRSTEDRETLLKRAERLLRDVDAHKSQEVRVGLAQAWIMLAQAQTGTNAAKHREELRAEAYAEIRRELYNELYDTLSRKLGDELRAVLHREYGGR